MHPLNGKNRSDSLAQQVEHNTFNVGVLGSSPKHNRFFRVYALVLSCRVKPGVKPKFSMSETIKVLCYKYKTLSNGEHPLMIRVCKDGKKKYQSLGISVKAEQWDFKNTVHE